MIAAGHFEEFVPDLLLGFILKVRGVTEKLTNAAALAAGPI